MRVLDRPAVSREAGPHRLRRTAEAQRHQPRMIEERLDGRRAVQAQTIAGRQRRRQRPILGPRAEVAGAEDDGRNAVLGPASRKSAGVRRRRAENVLDVVRLASDARPASRTSIAAPLGTCTPCRLAGSVAASLAITRSPGCRKSTNRDRGACDDAPVGVDDEQPGVARPLDGPVCRRSSASTCATRRQGRRAAAIASASSRAAVSGRLSVAGSASGTASACSGVSMSPGSSERTRTPSAASSSSQMRLM